MYENFFNLTRKPFDLSPNPTVVFGSKMHKEALATLRYGVVDRKGFLLLTGDVGTGKTTLLQVLINSINQKTHVCLIANPKINPFEFNYYLSKKFDLGEYDGNKAKFVLAFADFLKRCHAKGERVILIIDEAHVLPVDILEEIRLLSNQEYAAYGVMSIFLVGQPELNERLSHERLLPLRQRIGTRFHLTPFSEEDTRSYILFRLAKAGAQADIFTDSAIHLIYNHTAGVPRLVNIVCDRAMLIGFADSNPILDEQVIKKSIHELQISVANSDLSLPEKSSFRRNYTRCVYLMVVFVTCCLLLILGGQAYFIVSQPGWPGYEVVNEIHELLLKKGETFWEQYLKR